MNGKFWRRILGTGLLVGSLAFIGCSGDTGPAGPPGPPGPPGEPSPGEPGPGVGTAETCRVCHGENRFADVANHLEVARQATPLTYDAEIEMVDVNVLNGGDVVEVTVEFTVTDPETGEGVPGLTDDFEFTIAKWVPGDDRNAGFWQSYLNRSRTGPTNVLRAAGERQPAEDLENGNYSYTFGANLGAGADGVATFLYYGSDAAPEGQSAELGIGDNGPLTTTAALAVLDALDLTFDETLVHRIAISSRAPAAAYRFNAVADFDPATGTIQEELENWAASTQSCNSCHAISEPGATMSLPNVHGDRRYEVALCVTCHNANTFDRQASTDTEWVAIDLTTMIHKIHLGEEGYMVDGRDYSGLPYPQELSGVGGVMNCRACHDNQLMEQPENRTEESAELWMAPTIQGCGACHPTALGVPIAEHGAPTGCAVCHPAIAPGAETAHMTNFSTPNNPLIPEAAAVLEYEIAEVTVNEANQPTVRFRVLADGESLDLKAEQPLPGNITFSGANPNLKITWSSPVGAIAEPADWTNTGGGGRPYFDGDEDLGLAVADQPLTAGLAAIAASLEGPDAEGWFTTAAGINPEAPLAFPADAVMRAVFLEGYFTFADLDDAQISGESVIAGVDATETPRRQVVDINNCNRCHERIRFHGGGGRDNNPDHCVTCHNPSTTSSNLAMQTSNNFKDMIHAIHAGDPVGGGGMRENPYEFIRGPETPVFGFQGLHDFSNVGYPSKLSDCRTCHLEDTYLLPLPANVLPTTYQHDPADPEAALKITPVSASCVSCHDSAESERHMRQNGGQFFKTQAEIDVLE